MQPYEAIVVVVILAAPWLAWLGHTFLQNDAKIKLAKAQGNPAGSTEIDALQAQVAELRAEVARLRENSSEFDLALESSMHRLEQRLDAAQGSEPQTRVRG